MNQWVYFIVGSLGIAAMAALVAHYTTVIFISNKVHEARLEAVREKTIRETREEILAELRPEQMLTRRTSGVLVKKKWFVIRERLRFRDLPISGWVEHAVLLDEDLNETALKSFAETASFFLMPNGKAKLVGIAAKLVARKKCNERGFDRSGQKARRCT
jgi:hypothetical protein